MDIHATVGYINVTDAHFFYMVYTHGASQTL